ncbi:EMBRYO SURROUNDING FACTOR 1.1 [Arabidopsis thaliana]|uniref:EMBRYO SURROUNDING FACTOR 1.1 n=2 Tax=Arabidopsis TaxID=3701 RepID=ESF11_ARATH|nr:maternally expressed family protein [Arabidopsis thaliana]A8MSA6.1 RecName: Full=EMBRYO SURROUNDING FACTOR 1.1; AltName: Full=Maternally expressed family protein 1.1; AltName: Full=Maternally expressed gene 1.1; Flags: Precursor [Arabidopsis thaliana]AEE28641.1 maternally expressed family protein [Arabidopsis thaliana]KAG7645857.1 hypothetical protein ISN45_At01g010530 [Arabidopsis thaliana x Arabidopsis arenosa]|eukprot:NP_001077511.1 maternally expressed family protein [Arabidopsis thaliana]
MKSSHTSLICILMLSLVALHQCVRMKVKEIGRSNKIYIPPCFRDSCDHVLKKDCYCCGSKPDLCWEDQHYCNTHCPPLKPLIN